MADSLSDVEQRALDLVTEGKTDREIAPLVGRSHVWVWRLRTGDRGKAYLLSRLPAQLATIGTRALAEILARMDYGSPAVKLADLIKVASLALPYVVAEQPKTVKLDLSELAAEFGVTPEVAEEEARRLRLVS